MLLNYSHNVLTNIHTHMTDPISIAVKVDVFPDEFRPIMKAIKYSLLSDDKDSLFSSDEQELLDSFLDAFTAIALNEAL